MNKKINAFICIFLSFILCIGLTSCNSGQSNIETQGGDTTLNEPNEVIHYYDFDADYSIEYKNGGYVIVFENPSAYQETHSGLQTDSVEFSTMKEFIDSVTKGKLTDVQKKKISKVFKKDADGAILTCDFSRMYVPTLPDPGTVSRIYWSGETYLFRIEFDNDVSCSVKYLTKERYESQYQNNYAELFDRDNITVTKRETIDNKEVIDYKTDVAELKNIRYSMSVKGKMITVDKTFLLQTDFPNHLTTSPTVPLNIKLYCTVNGQYCVITLSDLTEDPTDEWLLEFGLTEFVDNESAEKLEVAN